MASTVDDSSRQVEMISGSDSEKSDEYVEVEDELPFPLPPLFSGSSTDKEKRKLNAVIDIMRENWDEGTDTKQKAYQRLRQDKNRMFEENKVWKKYVSIFKGLKRCH